MKRDFEADRKICDGAYNGPWLLETPYGHGHAYVSANTDGVKSIIAETSDYIGNFIAEARTGWPAALDEIERLQFENFAVGGGFRQQVELAGELIDENTKLRTEVQRYRQALESVISLFTGGYVTKNKPSTHVDHALYLAKEALAHAESDANRN